MKHTKALVMVLAALMTVSPMQSMENEEENEIQEVEQIQKESGVIIARAEETVVTQQANEEMAQDIMTMSLARMDRSIAPVDTGIIVSSDSGIAGISLFFNTKS